MAHTRLLKTVSILSLSLIAPAIAPTIAIAQETSSSSFEEIIVTAERRAVSLQRTAVSVAALTQEQLDASSTQTTFDLQFRTPGLAFKTNAFLGQPYIRGVGSDIISAGADATVATFIDDVYQSRAAGSILDFYDVERVEVLKGPQSTLFGRNVTGGAIRIFSKQPQDVLSLEADAQDGNYDKLRLRAAINAPVVEDKVFVRFAGLRSSRDGYVKNLANNTRLDDEDFWAGRGQVLVKASEDFEILISGDISRERSSRLLGNKPEVGCCSSLGLGLIPGVVGSTSPNPREVYHDTDDLAAVNSKGLSGKLTWDSGPVAITSITAIRKIDFLQRLDLDATDLPAVTNSPTEDSKTFTQDFQFASEKTGKFEWLAGLFYLHEDVTQALDIESVLLSITSRPKGTVKTEAYAAYGQASYYFTPQWRVTAGIRYSHENRKIDFQQIDTAVDGDGNLLTSIINSSGDKSWTSWTPKFGIEYFHSDDLLVYVSASRGFKAGGFNTNSVQPAFDPESLWAFEAGFKSTILDGKARFNMSAFWYDYKDIQLLTLASDAPVGAFPIVINAAAATVKGVEAELWAKITNGLDIDASVAILDATFDTFDSIDPNNPGNNPNRAGQRMPQAPKASAHIGVQYSWDVFDAGNITLRGEWRYQSGVFFNSFADPVVHQEAYSLFNARVTFNSKDDGWYIAAYGRNLGDKLYASNKIRQDPLVGNLINWGAPRTYGLEVGIKLQ